MTYRARPTGSRSRSWEGRDRRSVLMNVGFGLIVIVSLLLLLVAFGSSWYNDHLAPAATVNGQTITKDEFDRQLAVDAFRTSYATSRIRTLLTAGHIRTTDAQARMAALQQYSSQAPTIALEQLIDGRVMEDLAAKQGVTVSDADVDAQVTQEATTPELRHAWMIAVEPSLGTGETTPTTAEKTAAKAAAEQALASLKGGADWDTVARSVSTDASKDQAGDLGFIDKNVSLDADFVDALMGVAKDTPTDVVEGADGIYRIGRVSEIVAPVVDASYQQKAADAGVGWDDLRAAIRREALRTKLSDAVLAQYLAPGPQREVQEIYMQEGASESGPNAVRVRHILYSPNGDPNTASSLPDTDPAWLDAKAKAEATYAKLKADPSQFDAIARAESNEPGAATSGGKLPYYSTDDPIDPGFSNAIFQPGLQPGQILAPIKTVYGWHVIQVMHFPTDMEWAAKLKQEVEAGQDFGTLARDNSDGAEAAKGGDLGWVGRGQLQQELENAIFATPVGSVSDPVQIAGDGVYLFKVNQEATRTPDADQKQALESSAFSRWYSQQKAGYTITRDPSVTAQAS
jgi:parvulin-like peptidyl-prolyl isomerase